MINMDKYGHCASGMHYICKVIRFITEYTEIIFFLNNVQKQQIKWPVFIHEICGKIKNSV